MKIRKCATPITLKNNNKKAVLAIHGYAGYPGELALPAKTLYEGGFDVYVIRLPGHGTNSDDFRTTNAKMWIEKAQESYKKLVKEYEEVYLIGHSMGGAIATILASKYPVKKMVLYAPALKVSKLNLPLISIASLFVKKFDTGWRSDPRYKFFDERDEDDDQYLGKEYWSHLYLKQVKELGFVAKEALKNLEKVKAEVLVFTGSLDQTVPKEVGSLFEKHSTKNRWKNFEEATHFIPYDIDENVRKEAMEQTLKWFL